MGGGLTISDFGAGGQDQRKGMKHVKGHSRLGMVKLPPRCALLIMVYNTFHVSKHTLQNFQEVSSGVP